jgi:hypothetical protein
MKCVKVESYGVETGTDRPSPSWGRRVVAGSSSGWWRLMTGVVVRVNSSNKTSSVADISSLCILIASVHIILSLRNYNMRATISYKNCDNYKVHTILYNIYIANE